MKKQIKKSRKPRPTATERYVVIAATLPEGDDEGNDILVCDGYDVATSDEDGICSLTLQQARRLADYLSEDATANPLRANMTETLASCFITVEGQEGTSHGKGYEQARAPGGQRP